MIRRESQCVAELINWIDSFKDAEREVISAGSSVSQITEKCRGLAVYDSTVHDEAGYTALDARKKLADDDWFNMSSVLRAVRHFQLYDAICRTDHREACDILMTLNAHMGNRYCFEANRMPEILSLAVRLYDCARQYQMRSAYSARRDSDLVLQIRAIHLLKKTYGIRVSIEQGEIQFDDTSERKIADLIVKRIRDIGGFEFLCMLYEHELRKKYVLELGRYRIARDKKLSFGRKRPRARIPYNFLIQLASANLRRGNPLLTEFGREQRYEEVIKIASAYLEALHLQGHSSFEDLFYDFTDFPDQLFSNMIFEKMYIPRQYNAAFLLWLMEQLLRPCYEEAEKKPKAYSFDEYMRLAGYVLTHSREACCFTEESVREEVKLRRCRLGQILEDTAWEAGEVNADFHTVMNKTNTGERPLVRGSGGSFICIGAAVAGFGFYEAMYQILCSAYGKTSLNRRLGKDLERVICSLFAEKGIHFVRGKYEKLGDLPERDCDMIVEGADRICFIEIKKIPLPGTWEEGDDVSVLKTLGEGMLYAQEQILWHRVRLKRYGKLELFDEETGNEYEFFLKGRKVFSISLCMPEYDYLTSPSFAHQFLESTLRVSYHAVNPEREGRLAKLNKAALQMQKLVAELYSDAVKPPTTREVFAQSFFLSLQQVWMMLRFCKDTESFLDRCQSFAQVSFGTGDIYSEILAACRFT